MTCLTNSRQENTTSRKSNRAMSMQNWALRACGVFLLWAATAALLPAQTYTVLYTFRGGGDGANPGSAVVQGTNGNFYGVIQNGGVYEMTPGGTTTILYSFTGPADPLGALIQATDGNFYGTTYFGGASANCEYGCGTIFKMTPSGTLTTFYSFCPEINCPDGIGPYAGLVQGSEGNLYGTTLVGGANGQGAIFKISLTGTFTALYSFCSEADCADGQQPYAGLVVGSDGNLYGTASAGGAIGDGTVFRITPSGAFTTLHSFDGTDGTAPTAALIQAANGRFYGTTGGGASGNGTVFEMTPGGSLATLVSFDGTDGDNPFNPLVQATDRNFYGTTENGGTGGTHCNTSSGCGTAFEMTPGGTLTTLQIFDPLVGNYPNGRIQSTNGTFYGTTLVDGNDGGGWGTIFSLDTGLGAFVETQPTSGPAGLDVKILGNNLGSTTGVAFNGTAATFTVVSPSLIRTTVPAGATRGSVQVTTSSGTLTSNVAFRVRP